MTNPTLPTERQRAIDVLRLAGADVLAMLEGNTPLDLFIAASTLAAVGKLQDWTAEEQAGLWAALRHTAPESPELPTLLAGIDPVGAAVEQDDADLAFRRLIALAALVEAVGPARAPAHARFVERQVALLELDPPGWSALGPAASEVRASLMLPDGHLVEQVLAVLESLWEDAQWSAILHERARGWIAWAEALLPNAAAEIAEIANQGFARRMAAATDDDVIQVPAHLLLAARDGVEVYLVDGQPARLTWVGPSPPSRVTLGGETLVPSSEPPGGLPAWDLPDDPVPGAVLVLHTDPPWEVRR